METKTLMEFSREDIIVLLERKHNVKLTNIKMSSKGVKGEVK